MYLLMHLPPRQWIRKIVPLVRAATFATATRRLHDGARDHEHIAQVKPIEPFAVEGATASERMLAKRRGERRDVVERACEFRSIADRADIIGHGRLQTRDHRGGIGVLGGAVARAGAD